jgi:hypothetical protein
MDMSSHADLAGLPENSRCAPERRGRGKTSNSTKFPTEQSACGIPYIIVGYRPVVGGRSPCWSIRCSWRWILLLDAADGLREYRQSRLQAPASNDRGVLGNTVFSSDAHSFHVPVRGRYRAPRRSGICSGNAGGGGEARRGSPEAVSATSRTNNLSARTSYVVRSKHLGFTL